PAVADEDVQRCEIAMKCLAAVQLSEHLEETGDLAPCRRLRPAFAGPRQERAEVAIARVLEREAVQNLFVWAGVAQNGESVENANRAGMSVEQLPEVRLPQPPVDASAHLDANSLGDNRRATEPRGEIHLAEPALAEQSLDAILELRLRAGNELSRCQELARLIDCEMDWPGAARRRRGRGRQI